MIREKRRARRAAVRLAAFAIPLGVMLAVYAGMGVYPFGGRSVLITDMSQIYVDLYARLYDALTRGESLLHTWNTGMGLNFIGSFAFYLASPLSLLVLLFGRTQIPLAVFVMTLLKFGLCGLSFSVCAEKSRFTRLGGLPNVTLSVLYALTFYNVTNTCNLMWLDTVALLPAVMLCTERVAARRPKRRVRRDFLALTLWLCALFCVHYYLAYMAGIFCLLYFLVLCAYERGKRRLTGREFAVRLGRFAGSAALAAGVCAVLLLPVYFATTGVYLNLNGPQLTLDVINTPAQVAAKLLPGVYDTITYGTPGVFCGVLPLLLIPVYFANRGFSLRERLASGGVLLFLLVSMVLQSLYLAWHVFQYPTWFPARFSFVFCAFCLWLSARGLRRIDGVRARCFCLSAAACLAIGLTAASGRFSYLTGTHLTLFAVLAAAELLILVLYRRSPERTLRSALAALLLLNVVGEAWFASDQSIRGMDAELHYDDYADYVEFAKTNLPVIEQIAARDGSLFYRVESLKARGSNDGLTLRYKSAAHYDSFSHQGANLFLSEHGLYATVNHRFFKYYVSSPVTDSLLGIKYLIADESAEYERAFTENGVTVYENPDAFPLIFEADARMEQYTPAGTDRIDRQNGLMRALLGADDCYNRLPHVGRTERNVALSGSGWLHALPEPGGGSVSYRYQMPRAGHLYADFRFSSNKGVSVQINEKRLSLPEPGDYMTDLGVFEQGEEVVLTLRLPTAVRFTEPAVYLFNREAFSAAARLAQARGAQITAVSDSRVDAVYTADQPALLMTTIPADPGYRVYVDGVRTEPVTVSNAFLALHVDAGTHEISIRFTPKGLIPGAAVSAGSILLLAALTLPRRRRGRRVHPGGAK